jgi:hypothetical protein
VKVESSVNENRTSMPNPIQSMIFKTEREAIESKDNKEKIQGYQAFPKLYNPLKPQVLPNEKSEANINMSKSVNKNNITQNISVKMFNSCLVIIMLDLLYFFIYVLPLCFGISLHTYKEGFTYLFLLVLIAYQCDNGALFVGTKFGRTPFGSPVTPSKTIEGVYGGIILGYLRYI